jgi:hypothetical protein
MLHSRPTDGFNGQRPHPLRSVVSAADFEVRGSISLLHVRKGGGGDNSALLITNVAVLRTHHPPSVSCAIMEIFAVSEGSLGRVPTLSFLCGSWVDLSDLSDVSDLAESRSVGPELAAGGCRRPHRSRMLSRGGGVIRPCRNARERGDRGSRGRDHGESKGIGEVSARQLRARCYR